MTVVAWTRLDIDCGYSGANLQGSARISAMSTVMTAIGIGWGITWLAHASDYSRSDVSHERARSTATLCALARRRGGR
jgi:hypothetical protein